MADEETTEQSEPEEKLYSSDQLEQIVKKRVGKLKAELETRPTLDQFNELQTKLEALSEERELAGKGKDEKIAHQHARELEKLSRKATDLEEQLKRAAADLETSQSTLQEERLSVSFGEALGKAGVYGPAQRDALRTLLVEVADVERSDDGRIRASYGELIDEDPSKIATQYLKDRPYFAAATVNGAGTRSPSGTPSNKSLDDMTLEELAEAATAIP